MGVITSKAMMVRLMTRDQLSSPNIARITFDIFACGVLVTYPMLISVLEENCLSKVGESKV